MYINRGYLKNWTSKQTKERLASWQEKKLFIVEEEDDQIVLSLPEMKCKLLFSSRVAHRGERYSLSRIVATILLSFTLFWGRNVTHFMTDSIGKINLPIL